MNKEILEKITNQDYNRMQNKSKEKIDGDIVEYLLHFWHYNNKIGEGMDYLNGVKLAKC